MPGGPRCVLITGASGFTGRHLTTALSAAFPDAMLIAPSFDFTDMAVMEKTLQETRPDACIHLAAVSTLAGALQDHDRAWRVNLHGTMHLAQAILRFVPDCQLVYASSADAYGASFRSGKMVDERSPLAPLNLYTATKAAADLALGSMAEQGLRVVRLRPFNHIGPGQSPNLVVAAFARQVARIAMGQQTPVIEVGNLDPAREFLDVRDVCTAYVACVERRDLLAPGAILNLASGNPHRIGDVLNELKELASVTADVWTNKALIRTTDVPVAYGNSALARDLLGWQPATPWHVTLRSVMDYWMRQIAAEMRSP